MTDYFSYNSNDGSIPSDAFRISPSQLSHFLDSTSSWYHTQLLGEAGFQGNTASHLGNVVHAAAHMYSDTKSVDKPALLDYISSISDPEVDKSLILSQMKPMIDTLINSFLSSNLGTHAELFISHKVSDKVYLGGSIDLYDQNKATVYDFKTMGSLDKARVPSKFPRNYYFQQLAYAYALIQQGYKVDYCKLVYISRDNTGRFSEKTGKPLKDYPSEVNIVTHEITQDDLDLIEGLLKVVSDSINLWYSNPEYRHILAQDSRLLHSQSKPTLFIKD